MALCPLLTPLPTLWTPSATPASGTLPPEKLRLQQVSPPLRRAAPLIQFLRSFGKDLSCVFIQDLFEESPPCRAEPFSDPSPAATRARW